MDFDFAGLRQGARQTEHLRANRCLIYGQTVLHFESGLPLSWPPIWQPVESVEPVRAPSFPPSVPCPRRDRPGPRQGRVCTTTAPVLQPLVQRERERSPAQKPERPIADQAGPSLLHTTCHPTALHPLPSLPCCRALRRVPKYLESKTIPRDRSSLSPAPTPPGNPCGLASSTPPILSLVGPASRTSPSDEQAVQAPAQEAHLRLTPSAPPAKA